MVRISPNILTDNILINNQIIDNILSSLRENGVLSSFLRCEITLKVLPLDMVDNLISLFVAVFVRIWPQFGKELAPVSSKWRLFCLVTSQHPLRLGAWRFIH